MKKLVSILVFFILSCEISTKDPAPNPGPTDGGETTDSGEVNTPCGRMCSQFRKLDCEEGKPFYDSDKPGPKNVPNTTCEEFCESQMKLGVDLNIECATMAPSCDAIEEWRAMESCD